MGILLAIFWLFLCVMVGVFAVQRRNRRFGYTVLAFFLSPVVAIIVACLSGKSVLPAPRSNRLYGVKNHIAMGVAARGRLDRRLSQKGRG
jgi:hypothetical protein